MDLPIFIVDAFIVGKAAFTGNPAAVCILNTDDDITDCVKQKIASEMNLSETAFVSRGASWQKESAKFTIRWFTPKKEVPLCGHATLASSHVLFHTILKGKYEIEFESKYRGVLKANFNSQTHLITLDFPANPSQPIALNDENNYGKWMGQLLETILGPSLTCDNDVEDIQHSPRTKILIIRLKDAVGETPKEKIQRVLPNFGDMISVNTNGFVWDVIVTIKGSEEENSPAFHSRFFAPWDGIDEDPVTGLAHTVLTPYWTSELGGVEKEFLARQESLRTGDLYCTQVGQRVKMAGHTFLTLKGNIMF